MATVFIVEAADKKLRFKSDLHRVQFLEFLTYCEEHGKDIRIELAKNPVSDLLRGWYWGSIIPTVKGIIPQWKGLSDDEVHEILKKMFEYFDAYNPLSKRIERYGRSVMSDASTTDRATKYIERIRAYFIENYHIDLPNPEEYKAARDQAPLIND